MIAPRLSGRPDFRTSGYIYQQMARLQMTNWAACSGGCRYRRRLMMAAFAACGLPGFANSAGEIHLFRGLESVPQVTALPAGGADYWRRDMLRAVRTILHGPVAREMGQPR